MHSAWRTQRRWAFSAFVMGTLLVCAQPALAQKYARRSRPSSSELVDGPELEAAASKAHRRSPPPETLRSPPPETLRSPPEILRQPVQFRSPRTLSHQVAARPTNSRTLPDWQRNPSPQPTPAKRGAKGSRIQPAAKRMLQPTQTEDIELPLNRAMTEAAIREEGGVIVDDGSMPADGEVIGPGFADGQIIEEGQEGDVIYEGGDFDPWGHGAPGGCHVCGPNCDVDCPWARPCDGICIPRHRIDETFLFYGPQAFKGPVDLGKNGNFGMHEGVNFGGQFGQWLGLSGLGMGYQIGATFVHSNFSGDTVIRPETKERDQQFITAGLFRRAHRGCGFQFGAVYDWLHDNYYVKYNVGQVRAELSYLTPYGHEFGFWGAFNTKTGHGAVAGVLTSYRTIDMYNLFYRYTMRNGSQGRTWVGGTGDKGGVLGADFRIPLANRWDMMGAFNYLIPSQGAGVAGSSHEAWGLSLNLVWYPGRRFRGTHNTPYRALFTPSDNSTLIARPL